MDVRERKEDGPRAAWYHRERACAESWTNLSRIRVKRVESSTKEEECRAGIRESKLQLGKINITQEREYARDLK